MASAARCCVWMALIGFCAGSAEAALEEPRRAPAQIDGRLEPTMGVEELALDPHSAAGRRRLGRALAAQGRFAEAVEAFRHAARLDAELAGLQRELGAALFELGELEASRRAFVEALGQDPTDHTARLQLALCELELGAPEAAARRFDRVGREAPELTALALYNAAVAWARAGDASAAAERLERLLQRDPHPEAGRHAKALLETLRETQQRWRLDGSLGLRYADELVQREVDLRAGRGDGAGVVELRGAYRLVEDAPYQLEASYDFQQTGHFEMSGFDAQAHGFGASATRALGPLDLALDYRYSLATLGGDFLLGFHELRPALQWRAQPFLFGVVGPRFTFKSQEERARDGIRYGAGLDAFLLPGVLSEQLPSGSFLRLGLAFEKEQARGAEFDSDGLVWNAGLHWPFVAGGVEHSVDLSYRFRWRDYANATPAIGRPRRDLLHTTRLGLSRQLRGPLWLRLDYEHGASRSNLPAADYRRNAVMLGVAFSL